MTWIPIAAVNDVDEDEALAVTVDGKQLALYHHAGEFFASDGLCTHGNALLAEGFIEDGCIECPLHQALFDLRTGKVKTGPATVDIRVYPVKVEGETIYVDAGA